MNPTVRSSALVLLLMSFAWICAAQKLTSDDHDDRLKGLSDEDKVDYLIDNSYSLYSTDYDHALKLMREGRGLTREHGWKDKEAHFDMLEGVILYLKGDFENSLVSYLRAYSLFDSLQHNDGLARLSNELGVFYRKNGDTAKAFQYLTAAEDFSIRANNKSQLATSFAHRAVMVDAQGKSREAADLYKKVYQIRLDANDSVGIGYALLDLASIELRNQNVRKALGYIEQSTAIRKRMGDVQGVAVNLVNTGETYFAIKEYRTAIRYFEECLNLAIGIGYTDLVRYTYDQLSAAHVQINDYKKALAYHQKGKVFSDSLFNIDKASMIADLQTRYETEKKEQKISLQQAQLAERESEIRQTYTAIAALVTTVVLIVIIFMLYRARSRKQQELLIKDKEISVREAFMLASIQSQENERKRFAQDLHDGLGQLISALRLSLLSVNRDTPLEDRVAVVNKAEKLLNEMHREIRSIAFNLMPQTLVQHGLVPALKEMADRINQSGHINVQVASFDVPDRLPEVQEISLYRAVQEWINNIVKYSDAKSIEVQLVGHEIEVNVSVEDDGRGFDTTILETSPGNGWKNIRSRINLLKGTVEVDSTPDRRSTTLILRIPIVTHALRAESIISTQQ